MLKILWSLVRTYLHGGALREWRPTSDFARMQRLGADGKWQYREMAEDEFSEYQGGKAI